ncbi:MAG: hypothetical protein ACMXYC_04020 [Candidatus Woesearchaeota archaeon]
MSTKVVLPRFEQQQLDDLERRVTCPINTLAFMKRIKEEDVFLYYFIEDHREIFNNRTKFRDFKKSIVLLYTCIESFVGVGAIPEIDYERYKAYIDFDEKRYNVSLDVVSQFQPFFLKTPRIKTYVANVAMMLYDVLLTEREEDMISKDGFGSYES